MRTNQFDTALDELAAGKKDTSLTLKDGTTLTGRIKEFDGYVIVLEGEPMRMVYRHSILKLSEAVARKAERPAPRPAERQAQPQRPADRPRTAPSPRPRQDRPPRERRPEQERRPAQPARMESPEPPTGSGTMGEAMLKWLKSQKGGE
ncbi:MAG: RNA chaperone Hfq [Nitrospirae bacterium]|nr:RNA chaperone Hfq [Nitrospirota bacterium]